MKKISSSWNLSVTWKVSIGEIRICVCSSFTKCILVQDVTFMTSKRHWPKFCLPSFVECLEPMLLSGCDPWEFSQSGHFDFALFFQGSWLRLSPTPSVLRITAE